MYVGTCMCIVFIYTCTMCIHVVHVYMQFKVYIITHTHTLIYSEATQCGCGVILSEKAHSSG